MFHVFGFLKIFFHSFDTNINTIRAYFILFCLGVKDGAFLFNGNKSSYIEINNTDGKLDTKNSITILANIFPTGSDGPIVNYKVDGWGVHLWQFEYSQLFVRFVSRDGLLTTQPLGTRVLEVISVCIAFLSSSMKFI